MTNGQIAVAGIQIPQIMGNRQANISTAIEAITSASGHDIYVLPELSSSGYGINVFRALDDLAEDIMGPSFKAFSDIARRQRCHICYSNVVFWPISGMSKNCKAVRQPVRSVWKPLFRTTQRTFRTGSGLVNFSSDWFWTASPD